MDLFQQKVAVKDQLVFVSTSEEALDVFEALRDSLESSGVQRESKVPPQVLGLGSTPFQQVLTHTLHLMSNTEIKLSHCRQESGSGVS